MWIYSITAFIIAYLATPITIRLANKWHLVTDARKKTHPAHTHQGILPRAGGLPILLGILLPLLTLVNYQIMIYILLGAILTVVVGLLDDRYNLSPYLRFILNITAAGIAVLGGLGIPFITNPFNSVIHLDQWSISVAVLGNPYQLLWLADLVAILWIVWCMNMVNWSKGVDGQLPGFVFIAALILGFLSLRFSRHDISTEIVTIMCFVTAFAFLGFLPWNFYPQKILPGYAAGSLAGYMLGVLSILSWGKLGTLVLILILPLTDAIIVFIRRVWQKKSPFKADRQHFHHQLLKMGWSRRRIAIFYWLVSLIVGLLTLWMSSIVKLSALIVLFLLLGALVIWSYYFVQNLQSKEPDAVL